MSRDLVCVVDDDASARRALCAAIAPVDVEVQGFASSGELLQSRDATARAACLVLNADLRGISGLDLQDSLHAIGNRASVLFVSGPCDLAQAVRALRNGAIDFLLKPVDPVCLRERVREALAACHVRQARRGRLTLLGGQLASLTPREREVLDGVMAGLSNTRIAVDLGISIKTVEQHRARMMNKMKAGSLAELATRVTEWRLLSEAARAGGSGIAGA